MNNFDLLSTCEGFEWDKWNAEKIWFKHNVSSMECEQIFFNKPFILADDLKHSAQEERYHVLGQTDSGRVLFLAFTIRSKLIRVISARDTNKKERQVYEKENSTL